MPAREAVRSKLEEVGLSPTQKRLDQQKCWELRGRLGEVIRIYDSSPTAPVIQGQNVGAMCTLLGIPIPDHAQTVYKHNIFVAYGHDDRARYELDVTLRSRGLQPLFLDRLPSHGQTIIEKLEMFAGEATFAIVLGTPDDRGYRANQSHEARPRWRQNVVLEWGLLVGRLGRERVAVVRPSSDVELASDLSGLIDLRYHESIFEIQGLLDRELAVVGLI